MIYHYCPVLSLYIYIYIYIYNRVNICVSHMYALRIISKYCRQIYIYIYITARHFRWPCAIFADTRVFKIRIMILKSMQYVTFLCDFSQTTSNYQSNTMEFHGTREYGKNSMEFHGTLDVDKIPWNSMEFHGTTGVVQMLFKNHGTFWSK